jgi:hypothetical protein
MTVKEIKTFDYTRLASLLYSSPVKKDRMWVVVLLIPVFLFGMLALVVFLQSN